MTYPSETCVKHSALDFFRNCKTPEEWKDGFDRMMATPLTDFERDRAYARSETAIAEMAKGNRVPFATRDEAPEAMEKDSKALGAYRAGKIPFEWLRYIIARNNFCKYEEVTEDALRSFICFAGWEKPKLPKM